jgi:hypothetical protein
MAEVPSGYFPDFDIQWDIRYSRRYSTLIVESKTGKEQRRRLFPASGSDGTGHKGGYVVATCSSISYTPLQRQTVAEFLDSKDGAFKSFYLFRRDLDNFTNYYSGIVAASSSFIIPFKECTVTTVTVENVSKTFTVTVGVGPGGEDRINFNGGSQTGAVRVTLRARQRLSVRALNDEIIESFIANVVNDNVIFSLAFRQVR